MDKKRIKNILDKMRSRCNDVNNNRYHRYGARGIYVCKEWSEGYDSFIKWSLENGYEEGLSIDRIDNDKPYEPSNCRWATDIEQANNKSNNIILEYNGETNTQAEWSRILDIDYDLIRHRYRRGWSTKDIFETDINEHLTKLTINNETKLISEWSTVNNIKPKLIYQRLSQGWSPEEAIKPLNNKYASKTLTVDNETHSIAEWGRILGVKRKTLQNRKARGWSDYDIINTPIKGKRRN